MNKWLNQIKVKAILPAAALIAAAAIGTTFAWQQWDLSVQNRLKAHTTVVEVEEDFNPGAGIKRAQFRNTGNSSVFIRVSYTDYWEMDDEDGKNYILSGTDADNKHYAVPNLLGIGANDLWTDGGDGWYYYNRVLEAGKSTGLFADGVRFAPKKSGEDPQKNPPELSSSLSDKLAPTRPNNYKMSYYHLFFKVEAVQCSDGSNTLNSDQVNKHATAQVFGKSATVTGETDSDGKPIVEWIDAVYLPSEASETPGPAGT